MKVLLNLSSEDLLRLDQLASSMPPAKSEDLRSLLAIWRYMELAREQRLPIHVSMTGLHVLNDSALDEVRFTGTLDPADRAIRLQELTARLEQQKASEAATKSGGTFLGSLKLEPNFMGFGVDLRKLFASLKGRGKKR